MSVLPPPCSQPGSLPVRISRTGRIALATIVLSSVPAALQAQNASIIETYQQVSEAWAQNAAPFVVALASMLVGLDIVMILLQGYKSREGIHVTFTYIGRRVFLTGVGITFFLNPGFFALPLIHAFESAGTAIGGGGLQGLPDPTVVFMQGWDAFTRLVNAIFIPPEASDPAPIGIGGVLGVLKDFFLWVWYIVSLGAYLLGVGIAALVLLLAFVILAFQIMLLKTESFIRISIGLFFVGMVGSSLTEGMFGGYVRVVLQTGVRLFLMSAFFGIYYLLLPTWEAGIAEGLAAIPRGPEAGMGAPPSVAFPPLIETAISVALFTYLVWKVPGTFAEQLMREVHLSIGRGNDG